jgi:adenosylhomocysteine nucleosidase
VILVFYAFERELAPLRRRLKNRRPLEEHGLRGFRSPLAGADVAFIATGIGVERARQAAQRAFEAFPDAELVIGTGVVGALSAGLKPGDLVLADRIFVRGDESARPQHVHAVEDRHLRDIGRALRRAQLDFATGALLTTHRVLPTGAHKRRAKEETGAIAVDMETAALALEAAARGLPFACVRAVLDAVDDELVGPRIDEHGRVRPLSAAAYLVTHPAVVLRLPRMMRNLARATRSLAAALEAIARRAEP